MNRLSQLLLALIATAWLTACGPGLGGTGTGEAGEYLPDFGATPRALCEAPFAGALDCDGVVQPGGPAPVFGTQAVSYVDVATGGQIRVVFDGNGVTLDAACLALSFGGAWGTTALGETRFFGRAVSATAPDGELAQLDVEPVAGAPGELRLLLRTAEGKLIVGPFVVQPVAMPTIPDCS